MTNRPPAPESERDMKIAADWYTWGFQAGIEAEKKMAERRTTSPEPAFEDRGSPYAKIS